MQTIKYFFGSLLFLLLAACSSGSKGYEPTYTAAANLRLHTLEGQEVQLLSEMDSSKYTLLEFWRAGCPACTKAYASVESFTNRYADEVQVISVIVSDFESSVAFVESHKPTWTQLMDRSYEALVKYDFKTVPTFVLINKRGEQFLKTNKLKQVEKYLQLDIEREESF